MTNLINISNLETEYNDRIDYIRAAINNNQEIYEDMLCTAYYSESTEPLRLIVDASDFITLNKDAINNIFPWGHFTNEEIITAWYLEITDKDNIAAAHA